MEGQGRGVTTWGLNEEPVHGAPRETDTGLTGGSKSDSFESVNHQNEQGCVEITVDFDFVLTNTQCVVCND